ncbi:MFS transporter [Desulfosporosinus youngiae]|uniref:Sugar phosphate permease n=1 Tax=Desulfosporosinus youngiae DSM 17734 TaxID=768710 RepID=H5XXZ1_9FIRM|nr:MFS transporter [Desulfosporosinus youngiae]EHQ91494.1 sugar phosphate permease [Desulfosporosinus youngiae DSM 17734]
MSNKNRTLAWMAIAILLGYLPWYNFSAVSSYILAEFSLDTGDLGLILSSFQAGYVIMVIFTGWLADKVGRKKVVAWATLCTGLFSTLFAIMANSFTSILVLRVLTGLSAGAIYAPGIALLINWFPPNERGKAVGAYTGALTSAFAGGYFIAAPLAAIYNWRIGILATSIPAFAAAAIILIFVREKPTQCLENPIGGKLPAIDNQDLGALKKHRLAPVLTITGYMGHMWELYAFYGWIGPFLMASAYAVGYSKLDAVLIGGQLSAIIILLGAPAVWLIGTAADKWGKERMIILAALGSLLAELFFGFLYGHTLSIVAMFGMWIGFWSVADSGIYKVILTDRVRGENAATALGIQSAIGYSMTIISPYLFGKVLELTNKGIAEPIYAQQWILPFLMLGAGAIVAPLSVALLKRLS